MKGGEGERPTDVVPASDAARLACGGVLERKYKIQRVHQRVWQL